MKSLSILLILYPIAVFSSLSTNRHVSVVLENLTGQPYEFHVLHESRNGDVDSSGWQTFAPREKRQIFSLLKYKTGVLVLGSDCWKVVGKPSKPISLGKTSNSIVGNPYQSIEYSTFWKRHTLRAKDDKKTIVIRALPNLVHYQSPSGQSFANANNYSKKL